MQHKIGIVGWGSCSALGHRAEAIWQQYAQTETTGILDIRHQHSSSTTDANEALWAAPLDDASEQALQVLRNSRKAYQRLDRSVLLAMLAAEQAVAQTNWAGLQNAGLMLGSSRGASARWEQYYDDFSRGERLSPQASPLTTAGNLATHTAQHLRLQGFAGDSSITCSTALHALLHAVSWLEAGRAQRFLAGGTEAPLTPFTLAQMQALKIYAKAKTNNYPCRALQLDKTSNSMVLGEGSAVFALEREPEKPLALIHGIGYAQENTPTLTAVSAEGLGLQKAMRQALIEAGTPEIDVIVCHAPGTRRGDQSEWQAIRSVFGENMPSLASNKWKLGHCLGASGGLSLELALLMLQHQQVPPLPYLTDNSTSRLRGKNIRRVMINAQGFGGNAVSIIIG